MKKILLFLLASIFAYEPAGAQALPPDALINCATTKDITAFINIVKGVWLTPYGHNNWDPSQAVKSAYNTATGENTPCEYISGYDKTGTSRYLAVKNFQGKMVQIDYSHLDTTEVAEMRNYVSKNGFIKGYTTTYETWESKELVVKLPNTWEKDHLKISIYANIKN